MMPTTEEEKLKKVLMVAYVFPPIAYVGSHRTLRFCRYLPRYGWTPYILTINEAYDLDNDYGLLERVSKESRIYRTMTVDFWRMWKNRKTRLTNRNEFNSNAIIQNGKIEVRWITHLKSMLWEILTTPDHMVFWIPFAVAKGFKILLKEKCDLIYTTSPPHSEQIVGYILSRLFRLPWVADFRDPILDSSGYNPQSNFRRLADEALENLVTKYADKVLIISDNYCETIKDRYPRRADKFTVLPNGFDPDIFERAPTEKFEKFTILYSGSFYAKRSPRFFLEGLNRWLSAKSADFRNKVQVLFYGMSFDEAKAIVQKLQLSDVVKIFGLIPQDDLIPKLKGAHLLLLIVGFDRESRGTVTSKIFEYMACNRPILAIMPEGDGSVVIKGYDAAYSVNREDPHLLIQNLEKAFDDYLKNAYSLNFKKTDVSEKFNRYDARFQTKMLAGIFRNLLPQ